MHEPWASIMEVSRTVFGGATTLIGVLLWFRIGYVEKSVRTLEDFVYRRNGFRHLRPEAREHD
jgi:hypothetical protein